MIHTAMNEFSTNHPDYTASPMSVCSAMSQGYIGYDLQNAIREELIGRGIYRSVCTVITQVTVDPYDEAFYTPTKIVGRIMNAEDAAAERKKDSYVILEHFCDSKEENSPNGAPVSARVLWHENLNVHRKGNIRSS